MSQSSVSPDMNNKISTYYNKYHYLHVRTPIFRSRFMLKEFCRLDISDSSISERHIFTRIEIERNFLVDFVDTLNVYTLRILGTKVKTLRWDVFYLI